MNRTAQEEIELRSTGLQIADAKLRANVMGLTPKNRRTWIAGASVYWLIGAPDGERHRYRADWSVEADAASVMLATLERIAQRRRLETAVDDQAVFVPIRVYIAAATQTAELADTYGEAIDRLTAAGVAITFPSWQAGLTADDPQEGTDRTDQGSCP